MTIKNWIYKSLIDDLQNRLAELEVERQEINERISRLQGRIK